MLGGWNYASVGDDPRSVMANRPTHDAGQPAPTSATYEQLNMFGTPTGIRVRVRRGHFLPAAPIGHNWMVVEEHPEDC
jgi:hypothetical protein